MRKTILLFVCGSFFIQAHAQKNNYWKSTSEAALGKQNTVWNKMYKPAAYKLFQLNETDFKAAVSNAPAEQKGITYKEGKEVVMPDAKGNFMHFRVLQSSVMEPALAAKHADVKTFIGQGIGDATATIRFSITNAGFHAMILRTGKPTVYINALDNKKNIYAVNERSGNDPVTGTFRCDVDKLVNTTGTSGTQRATTFSNNADDHTLRQYRLALCVNGEFSQTFLDGTEPDTATMKSKVFDQLVVCLERANMVYERDFGVRLMYVDNEDTLIFIDPNTDPWPKKPPLFGSSWNSKTQTTIDDRIGSANYDIGHLLGKVPTFNDNNGNAGCIGCICSNGSKGSGFTAYYDPTLTDYMVIDYWTHEMGHQLGANHTFDFSSENTDAQIEPGSGSTIMGYAGITGSTDIQAHSDDLFSIASISQVAANIKTGGGSACATTSSILNNAPLVDAGDDYTIPKGTPFVLTGAATDLDADDVLSYIWEQTDVFEKKTSAVFPADTSTTGPIFRTYNYAAVPVRYFPQMSDILSGDLGSTWEALPGVSRNLDFRFTARDNHTGCGSNKSDDMIVTVDGNSGPFAITTQNSGSTTTWNGNETKTITWDVNNTNTAPVNCTLVNILLSTDGGNSFTQVLAASTLNDGSEDIVVPNISTTQARIKIEAVNNIFFTVNSADFSIEAALPVTWLSFNAQKMSNASVLLNWSTVNEYNNKYFEVQRSADGETFGAIGTVAAGGNPSKAQEYTFTDFKSLAGVNYYRIKQVDADGKSSYSAVAKVILSDAQKWAVQPTLVRNATTVYARGTLTNVTITVTSANGKQVYTTKQAQLNAGEQVIIPVSSFAKGVYIVHVSSTENTGAEKIVVE